MYIFAVFDTQPYDQLKPLDFISSGIAIDKLLLLFNVSGTANSVVSCSGCAFIYRTWLISELRCPFFALYDLLFFAFATPFEAHFGTPGETLNATSPLPSHSFAVPLLRSYSGSRISAAHHITSRTQLYQRRCKDPGLTKGKTEHFFVALCCCLQPSRPLKGNCTTLIKNLGHAFPKTCAEMCARESRLVHQEFVKAIFAQFYLSLQDWSELGLDALPNYLKFVWKWVSRWQRYAIDVQEKTELGLGIGPTKLK